MTRIYEHEIRMHKESQEVVKRMIRDGRLVCQQPYRSYLPGDDIRDSIYPLNDTALVLGDTVIHSDLYRLPAAEAGAILKHAKRSSNIDFDGLLVEFKRTSTVREAVEVLTDVRLAPQPLSYAGQLTCPTNFVAEWIPALTRISWRGSSLFLCLSFTFSIKAGVDLKRRHEVAIDTGFDPIFCVYVAGDDFDFSIENPIPRHIKNLNRALPAYAQPIFQRLLYGWCREVIEEFVDELVVLAADVTVEDMNLHKLDEQRWFKHLFRNYGIADWHGAWLEQRLDICDISSRRVPPRFTSQECHRCPNHPIGQRERSEFFCPRCGLVMDAHANAARNIYRRGKLIRDHNGRTQAR